MTYLRDKLFPKLTNNLGDECSCAVCQDKRWVRRIAIALIIGGGIPALFYGALALGFWAFS